MAGIEAVTFDLWFTLIAHDQLYDDRLRAARTAGIRQALEAEEVLLADETIDRAYTSSEAYLQQRWSQNLDVDTPEQAEILLKCMGLDPSPRLVKAIERPYAEAVLQVEPYLVDGATEALEAIRDGGARLALISNTGRTPGKAMRQVMQRLGILRFFEVTTFSNETGYLKPDGRIFEQTLSRLGTAPGHAVHIGDHPLLDVQGSKQFGMKSIHVTRYAPKISSSFVPDLAVESLSQLPEAIATLGK